MKFVAYSHFVLAAVLIIDMIVCGPRIFQLIMTPVLLFYGIAFLFHKEKPDSPVLKENR